MSRVVDVHRSPFCGRSADWSGREQPARRRSDRPARGSATGPCPCQSVTQRVEARAAGRRLTRARRRQLSQHPGPDRPAGARPGAATSSGAASPAVSAAARPSSASSVVAQQLGGAGQRLGDAAAAARPPAAAAPRCRSRTRRERGSALCGSSRYARPLGRARGPRSSPGGARAAGAASGRRPGACRRASAGPDPRPSPSSTVSAWSSRVWPSDIRLVFGLAFQRLIRGCVGYRFLRQPWPK